MAITEMGYIAAHTKATVRCAHSLPRRPLARNILAEACRIHDVTPFRRFGRPLSFVNPLVKHIHW